MTELYCPKCTDISEIDIVGIAPGAISVTCPNCGTKWHIEMEFHEEK